MFCSVLFNTRTSNPDPLVVRLCDALSKAMASDKANGWDNEHEKVYGLAEMIMQRTMAEFMQAAK